MPCETVGGAGGTVGVKIGFSKGRSGEKICKISWKSVVLVDSVGAGSVEVELIDIDSVEVESAAAISVEVESMGINSVGMESAGACSVGIMSVMVSIIEATKPESGILMSELTKTTTTKTTMPANKSLNHLFDIN
jgi:hypothetical protein